MKKLLQPGQAGTLESNDIMITIAPANAGDGITIELNSPVIKQYGAQIRQVIVETLSAAGIADALIHANDKGALDCTIRARLITAMARAASEGGI